MPEKTQQGGEYKPPFRPRFKPAIRRGNGKAFTVFLHCFIVACCAFCFGIQVIGNRYRESWKLERQEQEEHIKHKLEKRKLELEERERQQKQEEQEQEEKGKKPHLGQPEFDPHIKPATGGKENGPF